MRLFVCCVGALVLTLGSLFAFQVPDPKQSSSVWIVERPTEEAIPNKTTPDRPTPYKLIMNWSKHKPVQADGRVLREYLRSLPHLRPAEGSIVRSFSSGHDGLDFRTDTGAVVRATASGRVVRQGHNEDYGHFLRIGHGNGYSTFFSHLQTITVETNVRVEPDETIGRTGSSEHTNGAGFHYEVIRYNQTKDPTAFMP